MSLKTKSKSINISDHAVRKFKQCAWASYTWHETEEKIRELVSKSKGLPAELLIKHNRYERDCGYRTAEFISPNNKNKTLLILIKDHTVITLWRLK